MKKNSNKTHFKNEQGKVYFANVSARNAKVKKTAKEARDQKGG